MEEIFAVEETIPTEQTKEIMEEGAVPDQPQSDGAENGSKDAGGKADTVKDKPSLSVRFNHRDVELPYDEAVKYAQQGMLYENKISPVMDKLEYYASVVGEPAAELLDKLIGESERDYRERLEAKLGDDLALVEDMMELYHNKNREKYQKLLKSETAEKENSENAADSFESQLAELKGEFPEIKTADDIPQSVIDESSDQPLMFAYMKYLHEQKKRVEAERLAAENARNASAGSMFSAETESDIDSAFLKGINSR